MIRTAMRLFPHFFTADAHAIMRAVADRGPLPTEAAARLAGLDPLRACAVLAELKERGIVAAGANGYAVAEPEVWASFLVYLDRAKDLKEAQTEYLGPPPAASA